MRKLLNDQRHGKGSEPLKERHLSLTSVYKYAWGAYNDWAAHRPSHEENKTVSEPPTIKRSKLLKRTKPLWHENRGSVSEFLREEDHPHISEPLKRESLTALSELHKLKHHEKVSELPQSVASRIRSLSVGELVRDIRLARDKGYDGDPLNEYEEFLFNVFLNEEFVEIEDLARRLKRRAR